MALFKVNACFVAVFSCVFLIHCAHGLSIAAPPAGCPSVPQCLVGCDCGVIPDKNGCTTCNCRECGDTCPPVCEIYCECGNVLDKNGCKTCECMPCEKQCPPVCAIYCPCGNVPDEDGCPTCTCREPCKECPEPACLKGCTYIPRTDDVCAKCGCPNECPAQNCSNVLCQYGMKTDKFGCKTCECLSKACPQVRCSNDPPCPFGRRGNKDGCQFCDCACEKLDCLKTMKCANGLKEVHGCPVCECKEPCPVPSCLPSCRYVPETESKCPTCDCTPVPKTCKRKCKKNCLYGRKETKKCRCACERRSGCRKTRCRRGLKCQYGFMEKNGCRICKCNTSPTKG